MKYQSKSAFHALAALAAGLLLAVALFDWRDDDWPAFRLPQSSASFDAVGDPRVETHLVANRRPGFTHAPTMVARSDGTLQTVWYQGSKEGSDDAGLFSSMFRDGKWSKPVRITDAATDSRDSGHFIHTIGNPAMMRHDNGDIWLFYVASSGGWSMARIAFRRSNDDGQTWSSPKILHASPFFNISTLVRSPPMMMENGLVGLPAYFEFTKTYPVLLLIDENGTVVGRQRLNAGAVDGIQPSIVPRADGSAIALLRPTGAMSSNVYVTERPAESDRWSRARKSEISNPFLPLCNDRMSDGSVIVAHNPDGTNWRRMGFMFSEDEGRSWISLPHQIVSTSRGKPIGYCTILFNAEGGFDLVYSDKVIGRIHHMRANRAWLTDQIEKGRPANL